MKGNTTLVLLAAAFIGCGLFTGCETVDNTAFRPTQYITNQVPEQTHAVVVVITNTTGEATQQTNHVVIPAHPEAKPVAWEANPQTVATITGIGSLLGPYGSLGAAAAAAALGVAAHLRGRKYRDAAVSLAQGIQHATELFPDKADAIKGIQKQVQDTDGTRNVVTGIIDKFVIEKPDIGTTS